MSKKLCKYGIALNEKNKKMKYKCKKCGHFSTQEAFCCKPVKLKKSA